MPQMEAKLQVKIELTDKKITLGNLATAIKSQRIEARILEVIVHALDAELVMRYCGSVYEQGNETKTFQRAGTTKKNPVTSVGQLHLTLHKIIDRKKEKNIFRPIEDQIEFNGKKKYQEDISMISAELAAKMTYRDTTNEAKLFLNDFPCPSTVNRCVIEYGEELARFNKDATKGADVKKRLWTSAPYDNDSLVRRTAYFLKQFFHFLLRCCI